MKRCEFDPYYCRTRSEDAAPLDVERLVAAVHTWHNPSAVGIESVCRPDGWCRNEAAAIALRYAALTEPGR